MFDIGFPELLVMSVVALLVLGPDRLPGALRTLGLWIGRMRRSFTRIQGDLERELGMDDIRRQLHNESVLSEARKAREDLERTAAEVRDLARNPLGALDGGAAGAKPDGGLQAEARPDAIASDSTASNATEPAAPEAPAAGADTSNTSNTPRP